MCEAQPGFQIYTASALDPFLIEMEKVIAEVVSLELGQSTWLECTGQSSGEVAATQRRIFRNFKFLGESHVACMQNKNPGGKAKNKHKGAVS
jgi:hypothetical protein